MPALGEYGGIEIRVSMVMTREARPPVLRVLRRYCTVTETPTVPVLHGHPEGRHRPDAPLSIIEVEGRTGREARRRSRQFSGRGDSLPRCCSKRTGGVAVPSVLHCAPE
jgi:hypothetical protein